MNEMINRKRKDMKFSMSRDGSVGIATRYGLDRPGIESRWEARFSAPVQTGPGAHPASCTIGTGSFPGVKRPGRRVDHPPPSKCRGHERVGLYIYSPYGHLRPVIGRTFTLRNLVWQNGIRNVGRIGQESCHGVSTRDKRVYLKWLGQSPFNTLRIDKKAIPLFTIYGCLSIVIGSC